VLQDDGNSLWLKFAQGVVNGVFAKQDVLLGMVEALVKKTERLAKGKSLKNMSYLSAFSDFCNVLASTSTRAYKTFKRQFGGRGIRSMQYVFFCLCFALSLILYLEIFGQKRLAFRQAFLRET